MKKSIVIGSIVASSLFFGSVGVYAGSNLEDISAYLNMGLHIKLQGKDWTPKDANGDTLYPITYNGSTYLPVRAVAQAVGIKVGYDADTGTVLLGDAQQPTAESSRTNPADIGKPLHFAINDVLDNYEGNITVNQIVRGDNAWTMVQQANSFNEPAPAGKEYIVAKVTVEITKNQKSGAKVEINNGNFTLVSSTGSDYDFSMTVPPEPVLNASLYEGASQTGWLAFVVDKTDTNPVITFGRKYDGTGGIWFKTK